MTELTLAQKLNKIADDGLQLRINVNTYSAGKWNVEITGRTESGISLEANIYGAEFEETFARAWNEYFSTARDGNQFLTRPAITQLDGEVE